MAPEKKGIFKSFKPRRYFTVEQYVSRNPTSREFTNHKDHGHMFKEKCALCGKPYGNHSANSVASCMSSCM